MKPVRFRWNDKPIIADIEMASRLAVDETTSAAVADAKRDHPFQNVTSVAEGSIQMRPAKKTATGIRGEFGSWGVHYFIFLELGTIYNPEGYPTLRPAFEKQAPLLIGRIIRNSKLVRSV